MIRQPAHVEARRPPLRGICLVVKENRPTDHQKPVVPVGITAKFPRRPDAGVVSELILTRDAALRFVRAENGYQPQAVVMVSGILELDMTGGAGTVSRHQASRDLQRRIA